MPNFFQKTFKPFIFFAGFFTASAGLLALSPQSITELFHLAYMSEYKLLIQHWGFTTFLLGLALIISIYRTHWQESVFMIVSAEKLYMVALVLFNYNESFASGFISVALVDAMISTYLIYYLYISKKDAA